MKMTVTEKEYLESLESQLTQTQSSLVAARERLVDCKMKLIKAREHIEETGKLFVLIAVVIIVAATLTSATQGVL